MDGVKVLIANRGEIALRIHRTLSEMGFRSVGIYTEADSEWPFVYELDEVHRVDSYLNMDSIIEIALRAGARYVHPGYGFLAENPVFARKVRDAGLVFVGPSPEAMEMVGDKAKAKEMAERVGVPTVPGSEPSDDPDLIAKAVEEIGLPVLLKAVAGGGGKGMRVIREGENVREVILSAQREALGAFGDSRLMVERFVFPARHIEVQVLADNHGNVLVLGERECSLQRRHQKILEETPSPAVDGELRGRLFGYARRIVEGVGYTNAGTVEFLYDEEREEFYFLEVNARLQVEHPVTEMVTGLDLVRLQMDVASGRGLPLRQEDITFRGHSVEVRLYAEDPEKDFLPSSGKLESLEFPIMPGLRVDTGVVEGTEVSHLYDPMVAKVISYAPDREQARKKLLNALRRILIFGPKTNLHFLIYLLESEEYISGQTYTHSVGDILKRYLHEDFHLPDDVVEFVKKLKTSHTRTVSEVGGEPVFTRVHPGIYP